MEAIYGYVYILAIRKFFKSSCDVMAITTVISQLHRKTE